MYLPPNVLTCITRLEQAGYPCYAVGGCVRDALLGLVPHDYDLCTAATPTEISRIFADFPQIHAGEKHGTVALIFPENEVYEITTFRTEGTYSDSRHPDRVQFVTEIEGDLARRDFTVNAMAYSPTRGFADPFGGRTDLQNRTLRAVGDPEMRFSEDALRILRGVRFSVTYGLEIEEQTLRAMFSQTERMDKLARERVFSELCKLIVYLNAEQMLRFSPILTQIIPELAPCIGFDQKNPHHIHDVYDHTAHVLAAVPPVLHLRLAALLHDIGKPCTFTTDEKGIGHFYGHAEESAKMANAILRRLKASNDLREKTVTLVRYHMIQIESKKSCSRWLSQLGETGLNDLLYLIQADLEGTGTHRPWDLARIDALRQLAQKIGQENACLHIRDLAVNGRDLTALGYEGRAIGKALQTLLDAVLDEQVENEREALLEFLDRRAGEKAPDRYP